MDSLLIEKLYKHDPVTQERFYKKYGAGMFRICYRYLGNEHDAAEALNDGFFKVFSHIHTFNNGGIAGLLAWVRKIMINECLQHIRKNKHSVFADEKEAIAQAIPVFQDIETDAELYFTLISQLDENYRTVFNLFVIDGYSHQEISGALNIPENTSRSYLLRARLELQKKIEKIQNHDTTRK